MLIPGALIPQSYPRPFEPRAELDAQAIPFVPPEEREPLTRRAVPSVQEAEQIYLSHRFPEPRRDVTDHLQSRRALSAYEATQRIQVREDLRAFVGVDVYA